MSRDLAVMYMGPEADLVRFDRLVVRVPFTRSKCASATSLSQITEKAPTLHIYDARRRLHRKDKEVTY